MATTPRSDERNQNETVAPAAQAAQAAQQMTQAARETVQQTAQAARETAQQTTQAAQETARKSAEQAERVAQAAVDANGQVARAGAEIMQRNAEAVHQALRSSTEMMARIAESSAAQLSRAMTISGDEAQKAVHRSSTNVVAMLQSSAALAEATEGIWLETANFARDCMQHNLERFDHLLRCRTPQELVDLQSGAFRDNFGELLGCVRKVAEKSMRMAEEANRKFNEHIDVGRRAA